MITLSDQTQIHLIGVASTSVKTGTLSNGIIAIS
jgi:hypothetical protein